MIEAAENLLPLCNYKIRAPKHDDLFYTCTVYLLPDGRQTWWLPRWWAFWKRAHGIHEAHPTEEGNAVTRPSTMQSE